MSFSVNRVLIVVLMMGVSCILSAQKSTFENVTVIDFNPPYDKIVVDYFGEPLTILVNKKTRIKGTGRKDLDPQLVGEGTVITYLGYELKGSSYIATLIVANISEDGIIRIGGLFEGYYDGKPIIDGYPVLVTPGVPIQGSNRKSCDCKGLYVPSFNSPLIKPEQFYVSVIGKLGGDGVVIAESIELCRNSFDAKDQAYMAALAITFVDNTFELETLSKHPESSMPLFKGEVQIGDLTHKLSDDIRLQGYVGYVASKVIPERAEDDQAALGTIDFRTYVIENPVPNATGYPNGMIFLNTGLLEIIDNEAQLAFVIAREIARVRHHYGKREFENAGTFGGLALFGSTSASEDFSKNIKRSLAELSVDERVAFEKVYTAICPRLIYDILHPTAEEELQASRHGLFYAYSAGYDIREALQLSEKFEALTLSKSYDSLNRNLVFNNLESLFNLDNKAILAELSPPAYSALADNILDNIYSSNVKAKRVYRVIGNMISKVYSDSDWSSYTQGEYQYARALGEEYFPGEVRVGVMAGQNLKTNKNQNTLFVRIPKRMESNKLCITLSSCDGAFTKNIEFDASTLSEGIQEISCDINELTEYIRTGPREMVILTSRSEDCKGSSSQFLVSAWNKESFLNSEIYFYVNSENNPKIELLGSKGIISSVVFDRVDRYTSTAYKGVAKIKASDISSSKHIILSQKIKRRGRFITKNYSFNVSY